jgi:hypothetical protein
LASKGEKTVPHSPYLPDLAPADFFLFSRVKEKLAGLTLTQESFKNSWEGVVRSIAKKDYAAAFSADRSGAESAFGSAATMLKK